MTAAAGGSSPDRCAILVVCTGNICRSPMAEAMLTHQLRAHLAEDDAARFTVTSAGTHGLTGWSIERDAARYLAGAGITHDGFVAREVHTRLVEGADLVLGATREHRAAAVTLVPTSGSRAFTLVEFARLAGAATEADLDATDPVQRLRQLVAYAARHRVVCRPASQGEDDVPDPYGSSFAVFERVGRQIADAVGVIVDRIATAPSYDR